jgi:hypothetical protein
MTQLSFLSKPLNADFIRLLIVGLYSFLWMTGITAAQQYDLPPPANVGDEGVVAAEQIFDIVNKPTKECHASTIVETPTGLVAAWFAGTRERNPDVGIWIARQVGGK